MSIKVLDADFNQVVREMARRCWPHGYETSTVQTASYEEMRDQWQRTGRLMVNTLYSEGTIFGLPEVNWAFRAWHDWRLARKAKVSIEVASGVIAALSPQVGWEQNLELAEQVLCLGKWRGHYSACLNKAKALVRRKLSQTKSG